MKKCQYLKTMSREVEEEAKKVILYCRLVNTLIEVQLGKVLKKNKEGGWGGGGGGVVLNSVC